MSETSPVVYLARHGETAVGSDTDALLLRLPLLVGDRLY